MIFRNKILKTTASALAIIAILGSQATYINANELLNIPQTMAQFIDGTYELNTTLKHATQDKDSSANSYLKSSHADIKDGKIYMTLKFDRPDMLKEIKPVVDGKEVNREESINGDERIVTFEIQSIDSDVILNFQIDTGIPSFGVMNQSCRVATKFVTTPEVKPEETPEVPEQPEVKPEETPEVPEQPEVKPEETPEVPEQPETKPEEIPETPEDNQQITYKNGYYKLKNKVISDNETGYNMVRNLLNENMTMEVKDGKTYLTFEMAGYSMMGKIQLKVDGKVVNHEQTNIGNDSIRIKIEIPSVDSNIVMDIFVNAMSRNVEFGIGIVKSSIEFVSSNEAPSIPSNPSNNNGNTNNSGLSNDTTTNDNSSNQEVVDTTIKGKLYTIKNEIIEDNATGKQMARKYTNSTTKIEEVNGKMYATLTFTGLDLMKDHKIYVNGSRVSHQVVAKGSDSISIRFEIPNLDADIKVEMFIIPMGSNIDYGIKLLKDTLTFVKEYDAGSNGLPQTGSFINNSMMIGVGSLVVATGHLLERRKRK